MSPPSPMKGMATVVAHFEHANGRPQLLVEDFSHQATQGGRGEWLLNKMRASSLLLRSISDSTENDRQVRVSGHQDHLNVRIQMAYPVEPLPSSYMWHDDICEKQLDLRIVLADPNCILSTLRVNGVVAVSVKDRHSKTADVQIIVDHQNSILVDGKMLPAGGVPIDSPWLDRHSADFSDMVARVVASRDLEALGFVIEILRQKWCLSREICTRLLANTILQCGYNIRSTSDSRLLLRSVKY